MSWADQLRAEVPLEHRAKFLNDLQSLVAGLRNADPLPESELLARHAKLALAYMDEGPKKTRARQFLTAGQRVQGE